MDPIEHLDRAVPPVLTVAMRPVYLVGEVDRPSVVRGEQH
jgi:hypothetical protein